MIKENIDVVIKGDYVWNEDEQDFHENKIDLFKHYFVEFLDNIKFKTPNTILINVEYYPNQSYFKIVEVSTLKLKVLSELKNSDFQQKFNIKV